jgi:hypothetical protein
MRGDDLELNFARASCWKALFTESVNESLRERREIVRFFER